MVWDLIISFGSFFLLFLIFWKNERWKGGPEERKKGELGSSFVYTLFERQYNSFSRLSGVNCIYSSTASKSIFVS